MSVNSGVRCPGFESCTVELCEVLPAWPGATGLSPRQRGHTVLLVVRAQRVTGVLRRGPGSQGARSAHNQNEAMSGGSTVRSHGACHSKF